ncbi:MAG: ABC transporter ATP-binding protein [Nitrospirae bacterium]|nr:ABC transporter ATP-binding protein [Magnetococcales bacterium]
METLSFHHLRKKFGGTAALSDVSLSFTNEGTVALIGPNGAGKTTLLNIISGFLAPDSGQVFLGATEITGMAPYRIAKLGIVRTFQELRIIRNLSTLDNVMLSRPEQLGENLLHALLRLRSKQGEIDNRQTAFQLLEIVGLEEKSIDPAGSLSYGQQKLLALACCLATEAHTLILDEPVAGVHPDMIDKIISLLGKLKEQGKRLLFIEHDLNMVRKTADFVVVMANGVVIAQGPPDDVLAQPEILEAYLR